MSWNDTAKRNRFGRKENICWTCENACGRCSWSESFTPVTGWKADADGVDATNNRNKRMRTKSYRIYDCPEYVGTED